MDQSGKMHLCWNCDAQISMEHASCPYCGAEFAHNDDSVSTSEVPFQSDESAEQTYYHQGPQNFSGEEWGSAMSKTLEEEQVIAKKEGVEGMLLPLLLLLAGGVFFFFGALLLLFSQEGQLVLRWSQSYWMLYWGLSLPLLFIGWKLLKRLTA